MVAVPKIVIAGGGVIGNSIAYYLAQRGEPCILIDPVGIAPGASSKAGGFLAKDWRDGTPLQELQTLGFDLHQSLADELLPSTIDYRRLTCAAVSIDESRAVQKPPSRKLKDVEWVDRGVTGTVPMGDEATIAQVHPRKLCEAMWDFSSQSVGSTLQIGRVVKAIMDEEAGNAIRGVELEDGTTIETSQLVVACGPWSQEAREWFETSISTTPFPPVTSVKCHSILVQNPQRVLNQAVFFESDGALGEGDLEVYPRPDGDCYINGFQAEEGIVKERPGEEAIEEDAIQLLQDAMEQTTSELGGLEPHTQQACYWPETPDGLPMIGPIPDIPGAYVATGHSVWGIIQGPATGKAMAELLLDGSSSCMDLAPFSIQRFRDAALDDF